MTDRKPWVKPEIVEINFECSPQTFVTQLVAAGFQDTAIFAFLDDIDAIELLTVRGYLTDAQRTRCREQWKGKIMRAIALITPKL